MQLQKHVSGNYYWSCIVLYVEALIPHKLYFTVAVPTVENWNITETPTTVKVSLDPLEDVDKYEVTLRPSENDTEQITATIPGKLD